MKRLLFVLAFATACCLSSTALAEPLLAGLGGPAGFGPNNLPANDDGSSSDILITDAFPSGLRFFGMTFSSLWVNNNGNISFGAANGTFTPNAFPVSDERMIAPWWGDVDTRGASPPDRNGVYWSITPGQFVATWHNVGYYGTHDDHWNDFQLILTAAGPGAGDFDVEFRYNRCDWTTGDASGGSGGFGGTPAQAGFDAGNLRDYVSLPGSLSMAILNLCTTSNVGVPGVWRFEIRNGDIDCPGYGTPCDSGMPGICGAGTNRCRSATETTCVANAMPMDELCNGMDDDCDATNDEGLPDLMCGIGACAVVQPSCVGGATQMCIPGVPHPETCNLIDDDCNGTTDDMPDLVCGVGPCRRTAVACTDGVAGVCTPGAPMMEICNGIDDDCDGVIDDGLMRCVSPDANLLGDAAVLPDAAMPNPDASRLDLDGGMGRDAGPCHDWWCDPNRLNGRAGPGCSCDVSGAHGRDRGVWLLALGVIALVVRRRRSRTAA